jgi:hypothetical protein
LWVGDAQKRMCTKNKELVKQSQRGFSEITHTRLSNLPSNCSASRHRRVSDDVNAEAGVGAADTSSPVPVLLAIGRMQMHDVRRMCITLNDEATHRPSSRSCDVRVKTKPVNLYCILVVQFVRLI